jgi:OOP family OmpA-OmpF porin
MQQAAVDAFARAAFGGRGGLCRDAAGPELPDGWPIRVMAGLEALAELADGSLLVRADLVEVKGVTGRNRGAGQDHADPLQPAGPGPDLPRRGAL